MDNTDSDNDSTDSAAVTTSLSVQVSPCRSDNFDMGTFGNGGDFNDLSNLDYALILTETSNVTTIQNRVSAGGSLVQTGTFGSTAPIFQEFLYFNFDEIAAGDYYLVFMIDYDDDGVYEFYDNKVFASEMVFLGESLYIEDEGAEHVVVPLSGNVTISSGESHYIFFDLDIDIEILGYSIIPTGDFLFY